MTLHNNYYSMYVLVADDEPVSLTADTGSTQTTTESATDAEISPVKKDDEQPTTGTGKANYYEYIAWVKSSIVLCWPMKY